MHLFLIYCLRLVLVGVISRSYATVFREVIEGIYIKSEYIIKYTHMKTHQQNIDKEYVQKF